ncbi:MAG: PA14 domain-containing protein, partial [Caldilineaceae bacterium]
FPFPLEVQWQDETAVLVVALSTGTGQRVTAPFQVEAGVAVATATSAPSTATATAAPTATRTPTPRVVSGNTVTVLSPGLNVRSGPGGGYASIAVVTQGDVLTVIGQNSDGSWILVRLPNGVEGWVASTYTTYGYTGPVVTPQPQPSPTATPYRSPTPTSTSATTITEWRGEYFPNRDLAGAPVLTRNDANIDFNWGSGSPASNIGSDNFSVRWTRNLYFDGAAYRFHAVVDDGVRLWVDNNLVIDQWWDNSEREVTGDIGLGSGNHDVRVEYYEHNGDSRIVVWWERIDTGSGSYPDWKGEYWTNRHLDGNPRIVRNDRDIDFNWGNGSPDGAIPRNNFSARWTRRVRFDDGLYRFYVRADDGVRVWVDGERIIDEWHDNLADETYIADRELDGREDVRVEYYEREGGALIDFWWERIHPTTTPTSTPVAPTNTPTPTSTIVVGPTNTPPPAATPTPTFIPPTPTYTPAPSANVQPGNATVGTMITVSGGGYPLMRRCAFGNALLSVSAAAVDLPVYASTRKRTATAITASPLPCRPPGKMAGPLATANC